MTLYETTFIINPQTDDATINSHVRQVADLITENEGTIRYEDHMGTRRLAYEIAGLTQGYYASFIFEAPSKLLPVLQRHYKLNESYIRHLTVRYEGDIEKLVGQAVKEGTATATPATEKAAEAPAESAPAEDAAAEDDTAKLETVTPEESAPVEESVEPAASEQDTQDREEKPAGEPARDDEEL